jgi:hypothetical protein
MNIPKLSRVTPADLDDAWRGLYRVGGIAAFLVVVLNLAALALDLRAPPPVSGGMATLEFIATHRVSYILEQFLWLIPGLFAMIVFVALYPALKPVNQSYAALGVLIGATAWALTLALPTTSRGAPALVYLSDQYMAITEAGQRSVFAVAAEALIAQNNTPTLAGVLTPVGLLIVALVMVKGVFPKSVAYLGIVTGVVGILCEALRFVLPSAYAVYGLLMLAWFFVIGWQLYRLGASEVGQFAREEPPIVVHQNKIQIERKQK